MFHDLDIDRHKVPISQEELNRAKLHGEEFIYEDEFGKCVSYYYKGKLYVAELNVIREDTGRML